MLPLAHTNHRVIKIRQLGTQTCHHNGKQGGDVIVWWWTNAIAVNSPLSINIHTLYVLLNTKDCYLSSQTGLTNYNMININYLTIIIR